jgi:hypothetical protein
MPTNFDHCIALATRGSKVRVKCVSSLEPESWKEIGTVTGIKLDKVLSQMNEKNIQMYRILVDFGDGKMASVLPCILKLS